jgi:hypothetical protein
MAKSKIEWTDYTFNPWIGCTKVSRGCKFCYADRQNNRYNRNAQSRQEARRSPVGRAGVERVSGRLPRMTRLTRAQRIRMARGGYPPRSPQERDDQRLASIALALMVLAIVGFVVWSVVR